jgi:dTDP-4-amino-4,6-dideoxygalactose transaminase
MARTAPFPVSGLPAMLGGEPAFPEGLALVRPSLPPESVLDDIRKILSGHVLTNGPYVRELEERAADYLEVRHCVAVSSCTSGLMLILRVADLGGEVVVPSFTFAATAHAVEWNGLRPAFADIDPQTLLLSAESVRQTIGAHTSAILATHTYGTPCDTEKLSDVARAAGIRLFFDAAHAFGSQHQGKRVGGFGDAEVFSLSPTKVLVASEGGIIATDDDMLAERCRIGRDYGNPGDYDCRFVGLNARMSEVHAAIALGSLTNIDERIGRRNALAGLYREALEEIPGISFPIVPEGDRSTYKDFTMLVDADGFGVDAAGLQRALGAEGIESRRYYSPPVHAMQAYRSMADTDVGLPVTDSAAARVLTLPMWTGMTELHVRRVAGAVRRIGQFVG